mmetsp:Transcript_65508/g.188820  ORF Transcript_65508/g.188820 Transcript_65508/m.188820 type:complete len:471 (-) Transcript_65508:274-1686(-)
MMSVGLNSRTRAQIICAAEVNKSTCTSRISDKIASKADNAAGPYVLCLANTERPTAEKNFWSAWPSARNPARQQFSSYGAISISLDGNSEKAVEAKSLEYSEKRSRDSTFHIKNALINCANCVVVHSRSRVANKRLISDRNSPWYIPIIRSILDNNSAICSGGKIGNLVRIAFPTSSISAGVDALTTRCSSDPSHSGALKPLLSACTGMACTWLSGAGFWGGNCCGPACWRDMACLVCCTLLCKRCNMFCTESLSFCGCWAAGAPKAKPENAGRHAGVGAGGRDAFACCKFSGGTGGANGDGKLPKGAGAGADPMSIGAGLVSAGCIGGGGCNCCCCCCGCACCCCCAPCWPMKPGKGGGNAPVNSEAPAGDDISGIGSGAGTESDGCAMGSGCGTRPSAELCATASRCASSSASCFACSASRAKAAGSKAWLDAWAPELSPAFPPPAPSPPSWPSPCCAKWPYCDHHLA